MTLFDVRRSRGSTPWEPQDREFSLTLKLVNGQLAFEGLKLIRVEPSSEADKRIAYVLVRLDGREISPPRIYGKLRDVAQDFFGVRAKHGGGSRPTTIST